MTEKRLITAEDLKHIRTLAQPAISPDGAWIAYVRADVDLKANSYRRDIWLAAADGASSPHQLTRAGKDGQPVWSRDGRTLYFLSGRSGKGQIYALPVIAPGGEARALTDMPNGVTGFTLSPDGAQIAFTAPANADDRAAEDDPDFKRDTDAKPDDPRVVRRVPYRVGTAYVTDKTAQVYVLTIPGPEDTLPKPRRLTSDSDDFGLPRWSADGATLYTARALDPLVDEPMRQHRLFKIDVESGTVTQASDDMHVAVGPVPSPDGRWLAFMRFPFEQMSMTITRLALLDLASGEVHDVNLTLDRQPSSMLWAEGTLYFSAQGEGRAAIYAVDPESRAITPVVTGEQKTEAFDAHPSGLVAFVASSADSPQELYVQRDGQVTRLTHLHDSLLEELNVAAFNPLTYHADDGTRIDGWYLLPPDYEVGKQYPLLVNIHGGPHTMWGAHDENMWHEMQFFAARGYVVYFCNPRGSGGYGEAFQMAVKGQWGPPAMDDVMQGVDLLIDKGLVDTARMYVTGGSYGGYLTVWIAAHSDRFKAAASVRGVYNMLSFFGTADIPSFVRDEIGYTPLENPQFLWEQSPLAHAHRVKIPTLIIHSENDFRVPISEGEQLFGYLRRLGVETEFVRYPREGHELTRSGEPEHRIDHMTRIVEWFDKYGGKA